MASICCIIDFEGFSMPDKFLVRELGWVDVSRGNSGSVRFDLRPYRYFVTNRSSVDFVSERISGLSFEPMPGEPTLPLTSLESKIRQIYNSCKTGNKNVVAFKGGNFEKDILIQLGIPYRNLEDFGCPKYDDIRHYYTPVTCGYHSRNLHCPLAEVTAFRRWLLQRL